MCSRAWQNGKKNTALAKHHLCYFQKWTLYATFLWILCSQKQEKLLNSTTKLFKECKSRKHKTNTENESCGEYIFTLKHVWFRLSSCYRCKKIFILKSFFLQHMEIMCLSIRVYLQVLAYAIRHKELNVYGLSLMRPQSTY